MLKLLKTLALVAVAVVGTVSCTENMVDDNISLDPQTEGLTLFATTPSDDASTKVAFTDSGSGISLAWEDGDAFTIYDGDGAYVATLTTSSDNLGSFTTEEVDVLDDDVTYTAIYPASTELTLAEAKAAIPIATQDGDNINNLSNACYMLDEFTNADSNIAFAHQMAIMTFKFESSVAPAKLVFDNGGTSYTVNYSEITPDDSNVYTSHIMINPCDATTDEDKRTLTFSIYALSSTTTAYDIRTATTTKAYAAGKRYTASTSTLNNTIWSGTGTSEDPYQIATADDLSNLSAIVATGATYGDTYFEMQGNISLNTVCSENLGSWTPIGGTVNNQFAGTFDGGGYEISDLYINSIYSQQGLFGYLGTGAVVCNLGVSGSVSSDNAGVSWETGGIVAFNHGLIINCYNKADVSGNANVGGIAGHNEAGYIVNCYNVGTITGLPAANETSETTDPCGKNIGGLIGKNEIGAVIAYSYNAGEVTGATRVGGTVGYNVSTTTYTTTVEENDTATTTTGTVTACYYLAGTTAYVFGNSTSAANCLTENQMAGIDTRVLTIDGTGYDYYFDGILNYYVTKYNSTTNSDYEDYENYEDYANLTVKACSWEYVTDGDYAYPMLVFGTTND